MNSRSSVWLTLGIFAVFMPFAEAFNYDLRGWGPFPWAYSVPAVLLEFAIMVGVGYAYVRIWQTQFPRWVRVVFVLMFIAACVLIVESLREWIGIALLGHVAKSSSFPAVTGAVGGSMLAKSKPDTGAKNQLRA